MIGLLIPEPGSGVLIKVKKGLVQVKDSKGIATDLHQIFNIYSIESPINHLDSLSQAHINLRNSKPISPLLPSGSVENSQNISNLALEYKTQTSKEINLIELKNSVIEKRQVRAFTKEKTKRQETKSKGRKQVSLLFKFNFYCC